MSSYRHCRFRSRFAGGSLYRDLKFGAKSIGDDLEAEIVRKRRGSNRAKNRRVPFCPKSVSIPSRISLVPKQEFGDRLSDENIPQKALVLGLACAGGYKNQIVAIKVIRKGETPAEIARREARFAREVAMLSGVQHRNLVKFIGACNEPIMVIVAELLQGGTLCKYLLSLLGLHLISLVLWNAYIPM